ncbi:hypothetical protein KHA80_00830 [Anaerobacillus sp. HL2]|nr:hypothetical protein KHA80_00830 [Anaerobacillus sp. HL2]
MFVIWHKCDANGNLFIGSNEVDVEFEGEGIKPSTVTKEITRAGLGNYNSIR